MRDAVLVAKFDVVNPKNVHGVRGGERASLGSAEYCGESLRFSRIAVIPCAAVVDGFGHGPRGLGSLGEHDRSFVAREAWRLVKKSRGFHGLGEAYVE